MTQRSSKPRPTAARTSKAPAKPTGRGTAKPQMSKAGAKPKASGPAKAAPARASKGTEDPSLTLAKQALGFALDRKAVEPVILDVRDLCSYCSYQIVVSGRSDRQVDAIAEGVSIGLRGLGKRAVGTEGARAGHWALLDYGDIVIHVFHHPMREHYDLEGLWSDAPRIPIEVPADARIETPMY